MSRALVSLGSNVDRERNLPAAVGAIRQHPDLMVIETSCIFESPAVGGDYPAFFNAAIVIETELDPATLKTSLRGIETGLGRVRTEDKNAPRAIDLDVVLYDELDDPQPGIPDPDLSECSDVAVPAAEVAGDWIVPGRNKTVAEIAEQPLLPTLRKVPMAEQDLDLSPEDAFEEYGPAGETFNPRFEALVREQLEILGEDPDREGIERTPFRVAKSMAFLTGGYTQSLKEVVNNAIFDSPDSEMVMLKDIEFYSMCEHHMLPFFGRAHVAYIPDGRVIGVSKLARIVDVFARRMQIQERLSNQVADALMECLDPLGVGVVMEAAHLCMLMRGVQKQNSEMVTSSLRGSFRTDARTRGEFMNLVGHGLR
jgi:GTP cyclohydrolase I